MFLSIHPAHMSAKRDCRTCPLFFLIHVYPELSLENSISVEVTAMGVCHRTEDKAERKIVLAGLNMKSGVT